MSSIFNQLLNVKGTVVEDVRIVDSPLRPEPVLEVRVRPRAGALRCLFLVKSVFRVSSLIFFGFRHEECRPVVCFTGCPSCRT